VEGGAWLANRHPDIAEPQDWTRDIAMDFVAAVTRMRVGDYVGRDVAHRARAGDPLAPRTIDHVIFDLRRFFVDCQNWGWIPYRFDPYRVFVTPRSVRAKIAPDPRVLLDGTWAKLLWAGLNLGEEDLRAGAGGGRPYHPLELHRALAAVWLFAGLRSDEIVRLRVGCVRWQQGDVRVPGSDEVLPKDAVCLLDVPTHKTGRAYTKPVDPAVGKAIAAWEAVRPEQPLVVDLKTGERVPLLFCYRNKPLHSRSLNRRLIPMLCRKAGVPTRDARGRITSHRARATIATQLYNAREPMSLFDLQKWLGHELVQTTLSYVAISPTRLAKSYANAGYFARNVRAIEVLVDQEAIKSGASAGGAPWRYYDLGHGYCSYDFFDKCPHRMACVRCDFYVPKDSSTAQLLSAKQSLQRMVQEIPLTDDERAAVDGDLVALDRLTAKLRAVPPPSTAVAAKDEATSEEP
jgi:integrase